MTNTKSTVRVHIDMSLDISTEEWFLVYGDDFTELGYPSDDIRDLVENAVRQLLKEKGVLVS